jgi:ketosteroid isomerase-like protein
MQGTQFDPDRWGELADRAEISALLSHYYAAIDDKQLDAAVVASTFTADGRLVNPAGTSLTGHSAIAAAQTTAFRRFKSTHHVTSDHLVAIEGDDARLRTNVTAMHLWVDDQADRVSLQSHFVAGGVFDGAASRTPQGWRFTELTLRISWRTGAMPFLADLPDDAATSAPQLGDR